MKNKLEWSNLRVRRSPRRLGIELLEQRQLFAADPFSIAVLPDTQFYSQSFPATFDAQTQWILDNRVSQNIAFVAQLGDIVQSGESGSTQNLVQWQRADAAMDRLDGNLSTSPDGILPYTALLGNHDYRVVSDKTSGTTRYQEFFGPSRYRGRSWYLEESGIVGAHAQIFSAGGYRFLSISLQFEPLDADLAWAQSIIDQNPGLPTILNTHSYLNPSSRQRQSTIQGNSGGVPNAGNTGEQVFQKLVFNNPQIFLTMNGHFSGEYTQTSINKAGQEVFELVMDYQSRANGGDGWMRMMQFRPGDNRIDVSTYSPTRNEFELDGDSRFSLPLNFLERFGAPEATGKSITTFQNGRVVGGTVYNGTVDTQLRQSAPTIANGTSNSALLVDARDIGVDNESQTLIQFSNIIGISISQIPAGAQIISAELVVDVTNPGAGGKLHRMLTPWSNSVTWNSFVGGVQANGIEASSVFTAQVGNATLSPIAPLDTNFSIDVTTDVRAWASGSPNHGWAFLPWTGGTDGWAFSPSEAANLDLRPSLRIEWLPPSVGNAAPVLTGGSTLLSYVENAPGTAIMPDGVVSDANSPSFDTGRLQVVMIAGGSLDDRLEIRGVGNAPGQIEIQGSELRFGGVVIGAATGGFNRIPLTVLFNSNATPAASQALLRSVTFRNLSDAPTADVRRVRILLFDGDGGVSGSLTRDLSIVATNDGPRVNSLESSISYAAGGPSVAIALQASVTDPDSSNFGGGSLTISLATNGLPQDQLLMRSTGVGNGQVGISGNTVLFGGTAVGTWAGGVGIDPLVVQWNANASLDAVTAVLRNVSFTTASNRIQPLPRTIQIVVSDGDGESGPTYFVDVSQSQVRKFSFQQGVDHGLGIYTDAADIQLSQSEPAIANPIGSSAEGLLVDYDAGSANAQVLLRFGSLFGNAPSQIPIGSKILSARLVVKTNNPGDGASFHRMLTAWNGQTETWNSFGNGSAPRNSIAGVQANDQEARVAYESQVGTLFGAGDTVEGLTVIGVTADVQAWANGSSNFGWLLNGWNGMTNGWAFSPSESANPQDRPELLIDWVPASMPNLDFRQGQNGYSGTVDTRLQQNNPTGDNSSVTSLFVDYNSVDTNNSSQFLDDQSQALLRFDQIVGSQANRIPNGAMVHGAVLTLVSNTSDAPGDGGQLHAMKQPWSTNASWTDFSDGIQANGIEASALSSAVAGNAAGTARVEGGWNTFDVTRDVQSWVNNSSNNNGWAIVPWINGDNGWGIQSSETGLVNERPQLRVFFTPVGLTVTPTSGLQTTEQGGTATFSVVLNTPPLADVTIPISSSDLTEGTTSVTSLTFTSANWDIPQVVTITGVSDGLVDGNVGYTIVTGAATATDPNYSGINPSDVSVTNADSGSTNTAPTISNIGNQTTAFQTPTAAIPVTVFDAETALSGLTLSVTSSSNPALVPV
ncbi:MAG: DNRLRE domain-containing protein, partial [Planctomycetota bacterium]|nr:DNRLRE domain-containing protein [Planctomycetota bacterium]